MLCIGEYLSRAKEAYCGITIVQCHLHSLKVTGNSIGEQRNPYSYYLCKSKSYCITNLFCLSRLTKKQTVVKIMLLFNAFFGFSPHIKAIFNL